jgi:hypothetical protein
MSARPAPPTAKSIGISQRLLASESRSRAGRISYPSSATRSIAAAIVSMVHLCPGRFGRKLHRPYVRAQPTVSTPMTLGDQFLRDRPRTGWLGVHSRAREGCIMPLTGAPYAIRRRRSKSASEGIPTFDPRRRRVSAAGAGAARHWDPLRRLRRGTGRKRGRNPSSERFKVDVDADRRTAGEGPSGQRQVNIVPGESRNSPETAGSKRALRREFEEQSLTPATATATIIIRVSGVRVPPPASDVEPNPKLKPLRKALGLTLRLTARRSGGSCRT